MVTFSVMAGLSSQAAGEQAAIMDAILEASSRLARENLDLDGLYGGPNWNPAHFTGSASRIAYIQQQEWSFMDG